MERSVSVNGIELNLVQEGTGENLVLLPGLGGSLHLWYAQIRQFSASFRVTVADPRGHGRSSCPEGPYSVEMLASDLSALIRALDLAPATLIVSSMSCLTAVELAATQPELVRALVLVGGFPALSAAGKERFEERARLAQAGGMPALVDLVAAGAFGATSHQNQPSLVGLFRSVIRSNDPAAYVASVRAIQAADVTPRLAEVRCPTLVLLGSEEQVAPLAMGRALSTGIPGAQLRVLPACGHLPFLEQPAVFNAAVMEFLGGLPVESA